MPDDFSVPLGSSLKARVERGDGVATLSLAGEFDLAGVASFAALLEEIEATRPRAILVDLHGLEFIDSSGMRAVLAAHTRAEGSHVFAVLTGSGPVHRALTLVSLDTVLIMLDSAEELDAHLDPR